MTCLSAWLSSGWLEVRLSSARLGSVRFIRALGPDSVHLGSTRGFILGPVCSLRSSSGLSSCGTGKKCRITDELQVRVNISTWPVLGAKMLFLIHLAWEASEIQFSSVSFDQSCFNCFYLSWARDSVRLGSELGSFFEPGPRAGASRLEDSTRGLDST